jgi:hypothetical protein
MIRAGVPERKVLDIVGWTTRAMLDRYNIMDERDVHDAGEKMERYRAEKAQEAQARKVGTTVRSKDLVKSANRLRIQ